VPDISTLAELAFQARSPFGRGNDGAQLPLPPSIHLAPVAPVPPVVVGFDVQAVTEPVNRLGTGLAKFSDPIRDGLSKLSGGGTAQGIIDAIKSQQAVQQSSSVIQYVTGPVNVMIQGMVDDPAATARAVRAEFIRTTLRSAGREGPASG
jgi:hypothetical protein